MPQQQTLSLDRIQKLVKGAVWAEEVQGPRRIVPALTQLIVDCQDTFARTRHLADLNRVEHFAPRQGPLEATHLTNLLSVVSKQEPPQGPLSISGSETTTLFQRRDGLALNYYYDGSGEEQPLLRTQIYPETVLISQGDQELDITNVHGASLAVILDSIGLCGAALVRASRAEPRRF